MTCRPRLACVPVCLAYPTPALPQPCDCARTPVLLPLYSSSYSTLLPYTYCMLSTYITVQYILHYAFPGLAGRDLCLLFAFPGLLCLFIPLCVLPTHLITALCAFPCVWLETVAFLYPPPQPLHGCYFGTTHACTLLVCLGLLYFGPLFLPWFPLCLPLCCVLCACVCIVHFVFLPVLTFLCVCQFVVYPTLPACTCLACPLIPSLFCLVILDNLLHTLTSALPTTTDYRCVHTLYIADPMPPSFLYPNLFLLLDAISHL